MVIALTGMLLTFVGLESAGTAANAAYSRWIETLFAPTAVGDASGAAPRIRFHSSVQQRSTSTSAENGPPMTRPASP